MDVWTRTQSFAGMHICASSQLASAVQGFPAVLLCWPLQCKGSQRLEVCVYVRMVVRPCSAGGCETCSVVRVVAANTDGPAWRPSSSLLCWIARGCHRFPVVALPPLGLAWGFGAGAEFHPTVMWRWVVSYPCCEARPFS